MQTFKRALFLLGVFVLATAFTLPAQGAEFLTPLPTEGIGPFYRKATGTMAYIPRADRESAARAASEFDVFLQDGAYNLPKASVYWFIINHYRMPPEVTYVGVQIAKIGPPEWDPREPVYLFRNDGWTRPDTPNFKEGRFEHLCGKTSPAQFVILHKSLADASSDEEKAAALETLEQSLNRVRWHGIPKGADIASWNKAIQWKRWDNFKEPGFRGCFGNPLLEDYDVFLDNRLLRFQTAETTRLARWTEKMLHRKQVLFGVTPGRASAIYIRVFAPDRTDFDHEFYFTLGP